MSLYTINTRTMHELYENNTKWKRAIDAAFDAATAKLKELGAPTANDDRAEELIAAITYYVYRAEGALMRQTTNDSNYHRMQDYFGAHK